jgi:predicted SAM-dependent methyltransferase
LTRIPTKYCCNPKKTRKSIDDFLKELRLKAACGLNLGCGDGRFENVLNCDLYNDHADLKMDALNLSQFENGSVDYIESHHMIEHLPVKDVKLALKEWNRALRMGGYLVITCPDFRKVVFKWLKYWLINPVFKRPERRSYIMKMFYGNQENPGQFHKFGYDNSSLRRELITAGFEVLFSYSVYPLQTTPSMIFISRKI